VVIYTLAMNQPRKIKRDPFGGGASSWHTQEAKGGATISGPEGKVEMAQMKNNFRLGGRGGRDAYALIYLDNATLQEEAVEQVATFGQHIS